MKINSVDKEILIWSSVTILIPLILPFSLLFAWDAFILHLGLSCDDIVERLFSCGVYTLFGVMLFVSLLPDHTKIANQSLLSLLIYNISFIVVLIYSGNIFVRDVGMTDKIPSYFFSYFDNILVAKATLLGCICLSIAYKYWVLWQDEQHS